MFDKLKKRFGNKKKKPLYDDYWGYEDEYDYAEEWNRPITTEKGKDKKKDIDWGSWRGYSYYQTPTLDYRYIEQMANLFATQHKVTVRLGQTLSIDVENKVLEYNPMQFMYNTKAFMVASILHEIGHLRYTTPFSKLKSPFLTKYPKASRLVINTFEDFRIDNLMAHSYSGSENIYDANKPVIREMAEQYQLKSEMISELLSRLPTQKDSDFNSGRTNSMEIDLLASGAASRAKKLNIDGVSLNKYLVFGARGFNKPAADKLTDKAKSRHNLFEYVAAILLTGYGERPKKFVSQEIENDIIKTEGAIPRCVAAKSTQELLDILDKEVFPVIEELLKEHTEPSKETEDVFSKGYAGVVSNACSDEFLSSAIQYLEQHHYKTSNQQINAIKNNPQFLVDFSIANQFYIHANEGNDAKIKVRGGKSNQIKIPQDWANGDYGSLKNSVISSINQLVRMLTFLRRREETIKMISNQKRGRLNLKKLYKYRVGETRLFKKKLPTTDTIRSFAFSLVVDISGSMTGDNIINTTRGLILLSEVFEKMGIPYEIKVFNEDFKDIKSFDSRLDDKLRKKIGGLVRAPDDGTNLYLIFDKKMKELLARPEHNKYCLILSDGGVGVDDCDWKKEFDNWSKKHVTALGIGIGCGDAIVGICNNLGVSTKDAFEIPKLFAGLLKKLITKK